MGLRWFPLIGSAILLNGCAASLPPLYSRLPAQNRIAEPRDPSKDILETGLSQVRRSAEEARKAYDKGYRESAKTDDLFNVGLVIAATAAAVLLFDKGHHLAKRLGYGALGVGAVSAARGVASPASMTELYVRGHAALGCVLNEMPLFDGDGATRRHSQFEVAANVVQESAKDGRRRFSSVLLSSRAKPDQRTRYQTASTALNTALLSSDAALSAASKQDAAFLSAEGLFEGSVSAIQTRVATKGRAGRTVDYGALRDSLSAAASAGAAKAVSSTKGVTSDEKKVVISQFTELLAAVHSAPTTDDEKIADLQDAADDLNAATRTLTGATPPYEASLQRVITCPTTLD